MTTPAEPPPPTPAAPAAPPPLGTGRSVALGCAGFVLFYVGAGIAGTAFAASVPAGVVVVVLVVALIVALVRGGDARTRAVAGRMAIGFAIATVVFGGCLVLISGANFH